MKDLDPRFRLPPKIRETPALNKRGFLRPNSCSNCWGKWETCGTMRMRAFSHHNTHLEVGSFHFSTAGLPRAFMAIRFLHKVGGCLKIWIHPGRIQAFFHNSITVTLIHWNFLLGPFGEQVMNLQKMLRVRYPCGKVSPQLGKIVIETQRSKENEITNQSFGNPNEKSCWKPKNKNVSDPSRRSWLVGSGTWQLHESENGDLNKSCLWQQHGISLKNHAGT